MASSAPLPMETLRFAEKFDISFPSFINIRLLSLFNSGSVLPDFLSFLFSSGVGGEGWGRGSYFNLEYFILRLNILNEVKEETTVPLRCTF